MIHLSLYLKDKINKVNHLYLRKIAIKTFELFDTTCFQECLTKKYNYLF